MEIALKIRADLTNNINFIELASFLMPPSSGMGILNEDAHDGINETINFINKASEIETIIRGPALLNALQPILNLCIIADLRTV